MAMLLFFLLCIPSLILAREDRRGLSASLWQLFTRASTRKVPSSGYYNPNSDGGSMLTVKAFRDSLVNAF
jgi:hypothetical protein